MWLPFGRRLPTPRRSARRASSRFMRLLLRSSTTRSASPARIRSNARSISSSGSRCETSRSSGSRPRAVEVEHLREVALGPRRAVDRAEHAPLHPRDRERRQRQRRRPRAGCRSAPRRRAPAWRGTPPASPRAARSPRSRSRRRRRTRRAPRSAVASAVAGPEHGVASRRAPGRTSSFDAATSTATTGSAPDRDRAHHRGQADAAAADHRDAVAGPHAGGPPDGADAGRDRAADEPGDRRTARRAGSARTSAPGTTHASAKVERNE